MTTLQIQTPRKIVPLLQPARYKGMHGGRGSGKSHAFAEMMVEAAVLNPGFRGVCIREVQKSLAQSAKRLIEDKIQALGVGHLFDCQNALTKTPGGGIILYQGMQNHTAESIKSLEGFDVAWLEEASSISQRSLDLLRPTMRKEGSEIWASWNPDLETDAIDKLLRGKDRPPRSVVVEVNWNDNPWFPETLREEKDYDLRRDPDKYAHVWGGKYRQNSEARVFRNWRVDEFDTQEGVIFYYGADWGFSTDPTVLVRCYVVGRTLYVDREVYKVGCEIDHTPALFDGMDAREARKWVITADSARPETISYMQRNGYPRITPARKGAGSVEEGVEFLKSYDIVVHPRCRHTIDELTHYSYKVDDKSGQILPVLADKKNHVIDSLRYSVEALRRGGYTLEHMRRAL